MSGTLLFYDFDTDGAEPQFCRPTQFACIRTDMDLNPVPGPEGDGLVLWCKPPVDRLPAPEAVLITGITPQHAEHEGTTEREFFGKIHALLNAPGTIDSLHTYYEALKKRSHIEHGGARFQLVDARLSTLAAQLPPPLGRLVAGAAGQIKEATEFLVRGKRAVPGAKASRVVVDEFRHARRTAGNCAQWTSSGIEFAGLIPRTRLFPKSILIDLLESETKCLCTRASGSMAQDDWSI